MITLPELLRNPSALFVQVISLIPTGSGVPSPGEPLVLRKLGIESQHATLGWLKFLVGSAIPIKQQGSKRAHAVELCLASTVALMRAAIATDQVYVANLSSHLTVRELWKICGKMGTLVDVYIAKRKNHLGQMFAFCRYIKVSDSKTLIDSLSYVWIGKLRLHANVAKFDRNVVSKPSHAGEKDSIDLQPKKPYLAGEKEYNVVNMGTNNSSFAFVLNAGGKPKIVADSARTIVLDDECIMERDLSCALMGKIKDINALLNLYVILTNEGFGNVKLTYLGGFWVLIDVGSLSSKENFLKHVGVASWFTELLHATNSFVSKGMLSDVDVADDSSLPFKRLCMVTKPHIIINDTIEVIIKGQAYWIRVKELEAWSPDFNNEFCEDSSSVDEYVNEEVDHVSHTHDKGADFDKEKEVDFVLDSTGTNDKGDDDLDKEKKDDYVKSSSDMNVNGTVLNNHGSSSKLKPNSEDHFGIYELLNKNKNKQDSMSEDPIFPPGFTSNVVENTDVENLEHIINQPNAFLSINMEGTSCAKSRSNHPSIGYSGGLLCVWDPTMFSKDSVTISDSILAIRGANAFNHFISSAGLVDLPLEGKSNEDLVNERMLLLKDLQDINSRHSLDMIQKAKIHWAIEGDENSRYFHGIINNKRSQLAIRGVLVDGEWIDDPSKTIDQDVVNAIQYFFITSKFPPGSNSTFITLIPKKQDAKVVKDFRLISMIGSFYKIIAKIMANRLSFVISNLISDVQSAFVSNWKILDGTFILNELISWCKYNKTKATIFKVDFEKAFDSVIWDYLDDILDKFGFEAKWRGWIQGCLNSSMGSILVNGSPTSEFKFHKGLKQGDPLSPFLFILVMESLHLSFNNILNAGLFKGIRINGYFTLSHLFYADDVVFIGKWDKANFITIVQEEVHSTAILIGCSTFTTPFTYLGVKVGASTSRSSSWDEALYGDRGSLDNPGYTSRRSLWYNIIREFETLSLKECDKKVTVAMKLTDCYVIDSFRRPPRGGEFSVKSGRSFIDDSLLPSVGAPIRWLKVVPIKINIFAWKVCLNKLPTRFNLSLYGLDIPSILCPICISAGESGSHLFFSCNMARLLLRKLARWWELDLTELNSYEDWLNWFHSIRFSKCLKDVLEGVFYVMWWAI
nr:RNA-directed DNA polymerase, eukaryota, reverse transcriptase zinc-binding domain protein [Tanacetum cinerariifolium]